MIALTLPYPPSTNRLWRQFKGRTLLSAEGRQYRARVFAAVWGGGVERKGYRATDALSVKVCAYMPDARRRDLDNLLKASLDALTHAGIWHDDSQIHRLTIERRGVDRDRPRLEVTVEAAP